MPRLNRNKDVCTHTRNLKIYMFLLVLWSFFYNLRYSGIPLKAEVSQQPNDASKSTLPLNSTYSNQESRVAPGENIENEDKQYPRIVPVLPSKMKIHYHSMWNHSTSTIDVPEEYRNPFNMTVVDAEGNSRRAFTSLEILQEVLHSSKYKAEFEAVEHYMESFNKNDTARPPVPKCLAPDLAATQKVADRIVEARGKRNAQKKAISTEWSSATDWTIPFPVLNVGFPKVGSTTITDYFRCIKILARHNQEGGKIFGELDAGKGVKIAGGKVATAMTQLDLNFGKGFYPQISLLDEFHEEYPNSTMIFNFRPIADWIRSVTKWRGMRGRMSYFLVPGLMLTPEQLKHNELLERVGKKNMTRTELRLHHALSEVQMAKWWCGHILHLREYVKEYPSHALIEIDLYDNNGTVALLYDLFRADTAEDVDERTRNTCWGKSNENIHNKKKNSQ